jgi:hypothetical protein
LGRKLLQVGIFQQNNERGFGMKKFIVVVSTGGLFIILPEKYKKDSLAKFCNSSEQEDSLFYFQNKKYDFFYGSLVRLWSQKQEMIKMKKHPLFYTKAIFKVYFFTKGYGAWMQPPCPDISQKNTLLIDTKMMTFGRFLRYFAHRSFQEGTLHWRMHTTRHFNRKKIKMPRTKRVVPQKTKEFFLENIAQIKEAVTLMQKVQITKLMRLKTLSNTFSEETSYDFARHIAHKIVSRFEAGKSLYDERFYPYEEKKNMLTQALALVEECFAPHASIETNRAIKAMIEQIRTNSKKQRVSIHASRFANDGDVLAMMEILYTFSDPFYRKNEYDIARYFCADYRDCRYRLNEHSRKPLEEIEEFILKL